MNGMTLPRNLKVKKNADGTFNIFMIKAKLTTPLRIFEKSNVLTPAQVNYLRDYESRLPKDKEGKIVETKTSLRVKALLSKPQVEEPIKPMDSKSETIYTEAHYRRAGFKGYADFKEKEAIKITEQEKLRKEAEEKQAKEKGKSDAQSKK